MTLSRKGHRAMPFALVLAGLMMVITGIQNTHMQLGEQLRKDFTGDHPFTWWILSIGAIGAVGYIRPLRPVASAFLALILVVMFLSNKGGVFAQLTAAAKGGPAKAASSPTALTVSAPTVSAPIITPTSGGGGQVNQLLGGLNQWVPLLTQGLPF
jgi:hypothetical protein